MCVYDKLERIAPEVPQLLSYKLLSLNICLKQRY